MTVGYFITVLRESSMKSLIIGIMILISTASFATESTFFDSCFCDIKVNNYTLKGLKIEGSDVRLIILSKGSASIGKEHKACTQSKSDLIEDNICPAKDNFYKL